MLAQLPGHWQWSYFEKTGAAPTGEIIDVSARALPSRSLLASRWQEYFAVSGWLGIVHDQVEFSRRCQTIPELLSRAVPAFCDAARQGLHSHVPHGNEAWMSASRPFFTEAERVMRQGEKFPDYVWPSALPKTTILHVIPTQEGILALDWTQLSFWKWLRFVGNQKNFEFLWQAPVYHCTIDSLSRGRPGFDVGSETWSACRGQYTS